MKVDDSHKTTEVILRDKRDYVLSSDDVDEHNIKLVVHTLDTVIYNVNSIYDNIIIDKKVVKRHLNKDLKSIISNIDNLKEALNGKRKS